MEPEVRIYSLQPVCLDSNRNEFNAPVVCAWPTWRPNTRSSIWRHHAISLKKHCKWESALTVTKFRRGEQSGTPTHRRRAATGLCRGVGRTWAGRCWALHPDLSALWRPSTRSAATPAPPTPAKFRNSQVTQKTKEKLLQTSDSTSWLMTLKRSSKNSMFIKWAYLKCRISLI